MEKIDKELFSEILEKLVAIHQQPQEIWMNHNTLSDIKKIPNINYSQDTGYGWSAIMGLTIRIDNLLSDRVLETDIEREERLKGEKTN